MSDELPPGWAEAPLGEIARTIQYGYTASSSHDLRGPRFLRITDIQEGKVDWARVPSCEITDRDLPKYRVAPGDIVFARSGATTGKSFLIRECPQDTVFASYLIRVRPNEEAVGARFLAHFFQTPAYWNYITGNMSGIAQPNCNGTKLAELRVPLAPLPEQKRIADKLDALVARVDACRERLDRVPGILKRFRQSVLAAATSGELTREWREERGRTLDEWTQTTLEQLVQEKPRNGYSPRAVDKATPVKSLTLTATTTGHFRGDKFKYIAEEIPAASHLWLVPDDILIQRANTLEYVGVSAVFDGSPNTFIYPDLMMKCRANSRALTRFLWCALSSEPVRRYFRKNATGTAGNMPKINQQTVLNTPIHLPARDEQREICERVDVLLAAADSLEVRQRSTMEPLRRLSGAVLARAFRGQLVAHDPTDEPASRLIARFGVPDTHAGSKRARKTPNRKAS